MSLRLAADAASIPRLLIYDVMAPNSVETKRFKVSKREIRKLRRSTLSSLTNT